MKRLESMSRRIWQCLALVCLVCVLLSALGTAVLFHRAFGRQLDRDLARTAGAVAAAYENHGVDVLDDYIPLRDTMRLTLIEPDGTVLYDSSGAGQAGELENHLDRPEVQVALQNGAGAATRESETVGYETHYYALRLTDGNILRLSASDERCGKGNPSMLRASRILDDTTLHLVSSLISRLVTARLLRGSCPCDGATPAWRPPRRGRPLSYCGNSRGIRT